MNQTFPQWQQNEPAFPQWQQNEPDFPSVTAEWTGLSLSDSRMNRPFPPWQQNEPDFPQWQQNEPDFPSVTAEWTRLSLSDSRMNQTFLLSSGLERLLPPGANSIDPHWLEMQRRFAYPPTGLAVLPHGGGGTNHLPGVYPPVSLAGELAAREREKLERLGKWAVTCVSHLGVGGGGGWWMDRLEELGGGGGGGFRCVRNAIDVPCLNLLCIYFLQMFRIQNLYCLCVGT